MVRFFAHNGGAREPLVVSFNYMTTSRPNALNDVWPAHASAPFHYSINYKVFWSSLTVAVRC